MSFRTRGGGPPDDWLSLGFVVPGSGGFGCPVFTHKSVCPWAAGFLCELFACKLRFGVGRPPVCFVWCLRLQNFELGKQDGCLPEWLHWRASLSCLRGQPLHPSTNGHTEPRKTPTWTPKSQSTTLFGAYFGGPKGQLRIE